MKGIRGNYQHTIYACYLGYITQAIVNNFGPLLFLTFHNVYQIPLAQVGLLVTLNFGTQLLIDLLSAAFVDRIGYRPCIVAAHVMAALGLIGLGLFPRIFPTPFSGLCAAVVIYAIGGGLIEVLISPILEACPTEGKAAAMSLLHSFYCWGSVLVVVVSTVLFRLLGIGAWPAIGCIWAAVPLFNMFYFMLVPIARLVEEGRGMGFGALMRSGPFWVLALMMVCSGACEQAMSQWASSFAESGLKVSKTVGDLAGPCFFSTVMGAARVLHAKLAGKVKLRPYLGMCAGLCLTSYLLASLSPWPALSLLGCGLCGFSVGAMWPGTFSLSSATLPQGGTAMFALLALAGDLGCAGGPTVVGFVSSALGDDLKRGILSGAMFPIMMLITLWICTRIVRQGTRADIAKR